MGGVDRSRVVPNVMEVAETVQSFEYVAETPNVVVPGFACAIGRCGNQAHATNPRMAAGRWVLERLRGFITISPDTTCVEIEINGCPTRSQTGSLLAEFRQFGIGVVELTGTTLYSFFRRISKAVFPVLVAHRKQINEFKGTVAPVKP